MERRFVKSLIGWGNTKSRVLLMKVRRLQVNANLLDRHDGEILWARIVGKCEGVPEDNVLVLDIILSGSPLLNALALLALVGELAGSVQLIILVLCDPDGVGGESVAAKIKASRSH